MREADPTLSELQRALLGYDPDLAQKNLIDWTRERWDWAARGMVYTRKERGGRHRRRRRRDPQRRGQAGPRGRGARRDRRA